MKSISRIWIGILVLNLACATSSVKVRSADSKVANDFHDGNEAPVGMQPPRDISNEKTMETMEKLWRRGWELSKIG